MIRVVVIFGLILWCGATLILSDRRWFSRRPIDERLRPYVPGGWQRPNRVGMLSVDSFREVIAPLATSTGERLGRLFGVHEDLATRLMRVHSPVDPTTIRIRQLGWGAATFAATAALTIVVSPPLPIGIGLVLGGPLLAFLVMEQRLVAASTRWQQRLFLELPVVGEQIAMLLSAGYSLGAALDRISERGNGSCAQDLARVTQRVRQGLSDTDALREWADLADVPGVERLVGVLALNRDTGDLGHLIADEARSMRREAQRRLTADLDRRTQQVWIPVTVATLLPGTLFLAVPFLQAMRLFAE